MLFTLISGATVVLSYLTYREATTGARRYAGAKKRDDYLREQMEFRWQRCTTKAEEDDLSSWHYQERSVKIYQDGLTISQIVDSIVNYGISDDYRAFIDLPKKRKEALGNCIGGTSGMVAGLLGLLQ